MARRHQRRGGTSRRRRHRDHRLTSLGEHSRTLAQATEAYTRALTARYDGKTEWYESFAGDEPFAAARAFAVDLLGSGPGRCLDLGAGTGRAVPALVSGGWSVVGVDLSTDQLEVARGRFGDVAEFVLADAHHLPFESGSFDAVLSVLTHTDLDDLPAAFGEVARVLKSQGRFVYLGVHPCFGSPFVSRKRADGIEDAVAVILPGYATPGWRPPRADPEAVSARVGINHVPLARLINTVIESDLVISQLYELDDDDPPLFLAFTATAP